MKEIWIKTGELRTERPILISDKSSDNKNDPIIKSTVERYVESLLKKDICVEFPVLALVVESNRLANMLEKPKVYSYSKEDLEKGRDELE